MEITARAPGKIILAGEHAVVHGCTAFASSINLYTSVTLRLLPEEEDTIEIQLNDVGRHLSWPIERIKKVLSYIGSPFPSKPRPCSLETVEALAALVDEQYSPGKEVTIASGVSALLWLYACVLGFKPVRVIVSSELPVGAGLGSSAAYCVALSAALLAFSDVVNLSIGQKGRVIFEEREIDLLNKWAFIGEKIIHGNPSGIDNAVSTFGNVIKFKSGCMTRISAKMPVRMLITNTKVSRDTMALITNVSLRKSRHPDAMSSVLNAIESISDEWCSIIQSHAKDHRALSTNEVKLAELMEINQGLLISLGVSHAAIDTVLRTTTKYKLASKLTGAGGGGCVLTLLPTELSEAVLEKLVEELESFGFQCYTAGIGGKGIEINVNGDP
ncbi:hypothetical protein DITRI_Ditri06bG0163300 [Diplodiscus trichospermus]